MASKTENLKETHSCENNQSRLWHICTKYEIPKYRKNIIGNIRDTYAKYFNIKFPQRDESWAPHIIYSACNLMLYKCEESENNASSKFIIPVIWEKLQNERDGFFYMNNAKNEEFLTKNQ